MDYKTSDVELLENDEEYVLMLEEDSYRDRNICPSCCGFGDHGYDDENCQLTCYRCSGTGYYY